MKSRYPEVKLIQCLLESNKGLNKDFLILSGEWSDGLPYRTREGEPYGVLSLGYLFISSSFWFIVFLCLIKFYFPNEFANKRTNKPNLSLVNKESFDKILHAEVFVHNKGQLRAAHIILGYKPISSGFQALKCVIKAKDPRLHRISVAVPGFLLPEGAPGLEGTFPTQTIWESDPFSQLIPEGIPRVVLPFQHPASASGSSQPSDKDEEVVEVLESEDEFKAFNRPLSP